MNDVIKFVTRIITHPGLNLQRDNIFRALEKIGNEASHARVDAAYFKFRSNV